MNDIANSLIKKLGHKTPEWLQSPDELGEFVAKCNCCDGKFKFDIMDENHWYLHYEMKGLRYDLVDYYLHRSKMNLDFFYCPKVQALL